MATKPTRYFSEVATEIDHLDTALRELAEVLNMPPGVIEEAALHTALVGAQGSPDPSRALKKIRGVIQRSQALAFGVRAHLNEFDKNLRADHLVQEAQWKLARSNEWLNWIHRTTRWILGAALVVAIYSVAVNLSERYPFIRVPVHEWLASPSDSS